LVHPSGIELDEVNWFRRHDTVKSTAVPSDVDSFDEAGSESVFGLASLTKLQDRVTQEAERRFLEEAILCLKTRAYRAAIVMTWLLASDHLQEVIIQCSLAMFNDALARRPDSKGIAIRAKEDFAILRESVVIESSQSAGIIARDVRKLLDEKLSIRNSCAHPSPLEIREAKAVSFIEDLVENFILKYPLPQP